MSRVTASLACSMKAGTAATGTETSCLIEPPSGFCDGEISSRSFQNAARWLRLSAITASSITSCSSAAVRIASSVSRASLRGDDTSSSTYQGWRPESGSRLPIATLKRTAISAISSKLVSSLAAASRASCNSVSACCGERSPTKAVATARGLGNSLSVAAVMMPSVPSAPMNRSRRS